MLNTSQIESFKSNAYLVLHELFSLEQMNKLKSAAQEIVDKFDPESSKSVFSTKNADTSRDDYFLSSGDKVRCFFEEEAFSDNGELLQDKSVSINKIGHALHSLHPVFKEFSCSKTISDLAKDLGCEQPEIRQSMYIFKQPKIGGVIRWHQDATYFYTSPQSVLTFWLAIEDANLENGCLQVHSGGDNYVLKEQFIRDENNNTELVPLADTNWPADDSAKPLEVKAGSLVIFNGTLPHFSEANRSSKSRHAFTLHITSGKSIYHPANWLQASPVAI